MVLLLLLLLVLPVAVYLLGNSWCSCQGHFGFFLVPEELILNNWVFLPEDINHHYEVIEMLFNHARKTIKKKCKIQFMCIHNLNSVLKFCYPYKFFLVKHRISSLKKSTYCVNFFWPQSLSDCVWQKKVAENSFTNRTIEKKKKVYFPLLSFLQITFFAYIFLSSRGKIKSKCWRFQKDVSTKKN